MRDNLGRNIEYVRISITDRCNLRCFYCTNYKNFVPFKHEEVLTYEEILKIITVLRDFGIKKVRITGGEPLVRKDVDKLLLEIKKIEGIERLTLTTNGTLLTRYLEAIEMAKVDAVNVSLDALNLEVYEKISGFRRLDNVREGIVGLKERGIPVKINVVYSKLNLSEVENLLNFASELSIPLRFIELMPFSEDWKEYYVPEALLIDRLKGCGELIPMERKLGDGPARYYFMEFYGKPLTIGLISAMSHQFCGGCNRIRITADGKLLPCMASEIKYDLRSILRSFESNKEEKLREVIFKAIYFKPARHNLLNKSPNEMRKLGG